MWKKDQSKKKETKSLRLAFLALGFLILIILLAKFVSLLIGLNKPITQEFQTNKVYSWDGKTSFNIAIAQLKGVETTVTVLSYHPQDQKTIVLHISDQTYLDLPKGFGSWKVSSIYKLGQEESSPIGASLLKLSLSKLLGLPIDGIIIDQSKQDKNPEGLVDEWRKNTFAMAKFIYSSKTDLTSIEAFKLLKAISAVRQDKLTSLDFEKSSVTQSMLLPDSSRVLGIDNVKLDTFIRENMSDSGIVDEGLSVAVFNATSHPGMAGAVSRVITNLGGNAITVATTENLSPTSYVTVAKGIDISKSVTAKRLTETFAPNCLKNDCQSTDAKVLNSRAQINIVLGEDYFDTWYTRK